MKKGKLVDQTFAKRKRSRMIYRQAMVASLLRGKNQSTISFAHIILIADIASSMLSGDHCSSTAFDSIRSM